VAAAAAQRLHLQRLAATAAAMRYSPYHLTAPPCLPLPGALAAQPTLFVQLSFMHSPFMQISPTFSLFCICRPSRFKNRLVPFTIPGRHTRRRTPRLLH